MSELVQSYIPVVNRGGRLWAKCPFHGGGNEKTPSFAINDNDGFYHCFGCGESGDMFTFVMKMDKVTFPEAVEALASRAGVELETDRNPEARKAAGESEVLFDLNQRIQRTFHYMLVSADEGKAAREYLERRKVSAEMIERFQLGYAPKGSDWLYSFLSGKGFSDDILTNVALNAALTILKSEERRLSHLSEKDDPSGDSDMAVFADFLGGKIRIFAFQPFAVVRDRELVTEGIDSLFLVKSQFFSSSLLLVVEVVDRSRVLVFHIFSLSKKNK